MSRPEEELQLRNLLHQRHRTAEQEALHPALAELLGEAKRDFPRAELLVSQIGINTGGWGGSFTLRDEEGHNVFNIQSGAETSLEAAQKALDSARKMFRTPFLGRNFTEIREARYPVQQ